MEEDNCKVIVSGNAHKLLFGDDVTEIKVKQDTSPIMNKQTSISQMKHKAPQIQKGLAKKPEVGYGQKYGAKKAFATPKKDQDPIPAPTKAAKRVESDNPLFNVNPLPSLSEEYKDPYMDDMYSQEYINPQPVITSNSYQYLNNAQRNIPTNQRHEIMKANFEQNRRNNFANVSSNIVSSREKQSQDTISTSNMGTRISHSKNTNHGYVKMTNGPSFGGAQSVINQNPAYRTEEQYYPKSMQPNLQNQQSQPEMAKRMPNGKVKDSILKQYSHNLPPHQIEYKSGFQDIPPPLYNVSENDMHVKAQPKPLPGNSDLDDFQDFYNDIR